MPRYQARRQLKPKGLVCQNPLMPRQSKMSQGSEAPSKGMGESARVPDEPFESLESSIRQIERTRAKLKQTALRLRAEIRRAREKVNAARGILPS